MQSRVDISPRSGLGGAAARVMGLPVLAILVSGLTSTAAAQANPDRPGTDGRSALVIAEATGASASVSPGPSDLRIRVLGPPAALAGDTIRYTIQLANAGPADATDIVVRQRVPDGNRFLSASHEGTVGPDGVLTWPEIPILRSGRALSLMFRVLAGDGEGAGDDEAAGPTPAPARPSAGTAWTPVPIPANGEQGTVETGVWVTAGSADPVPANDVSTVSTTLVQDTTADLQIIKTGPATAFPGDIITYRINVRNLGRRSAEHVFVTDSLLGGGRIVGASGNTVVLTNRVVAWQEIPVLNVGQDTTFTVQVLVEGCGEITNTARVRALLPTDPDTRNNRSSVPTRILCDADVEIIKTGPLRVNAGDTVRYQLRFRNRGPAAAFGVVVTDTLPEHGRFLSASPPATLQGRVLTWETIPRMEPGDSAVYAVTFLAPNQPGVPTITNVGVVRSLSPVDPDTSNNRSRITTVIGPPPVLRTDVGVSKAGPASVMLSDTIVYTITVRNNGPIAAANVSVRDSLPHAGTFVSATGGATRVGRLLTWPVIELLPVGGTATYTIRHVAPSCPDNLVNVALVSTTTEDTVPANNRSAVPTAVTGRACAVVLNVAKTAVDTFRLGATARFRVAVTNTGTIPTSGPITVTDTLAAGLTFVSGSGTGWTVTGTGQVVRGVFSGVLNPGQTSSFEITVRIGSAAVPRVCNRAWAVFPGGSPVSSEVCVPVEFAELNLRKSVSRTEAEIGDVLEYRLVVGVTGNAAVRDVVVADVLPMGFRYIAGTYRLDGRAVPDPTGAPGPSLAFAVGRVEPGRAMVLTYRVLVGPGTPVGEAINHARAFGGGKESNEATARVFVRGPADEGMIVGKVFVDSVPLVREGDRTVEGDPDRRQTPGEVGIPGVRVWLQDGTSAVTDRDGRFLFYGLRPRTWIVKVDTSTLPAGARLLALTGRYARDGGMVEVELKRGELHRADFAVRGDSEVVTQLERRRSRADSIGIRLDTRDFVEGNPGSTLDSGVRLRDYMALRPTSSVEDLDRRIRGWGLAGIGGGAGTAEPGDTARRPAPAAQARADSARGAGWFGSTLVMGLLEARIDFRSLTDAEIGGRSRRNRFEDEILRATHRDDDGRRTAGSRGALFYRGSPGEGYGLTVRLESERDERLGLFRDIRPDDFYPIWGDASVRSFGAQSRSRVFGILETGSSYLTYGDIHTGGLGMGGTLRAGAGVGGTGSVLADYARSLTGVLEHWERDWGTVTAWAAWERSRQVVDVIRGMGISGPYALSRTDGLVNSERVELVTRDRNQPATILRVEPLLRFLDYTIEPLTGRLVFKRPVPSVDDALNPVEIRVTYEVEAGGDRSWAWGANGQFRPAEFLEVGGNIVRDDNGLARFDLAGVNATLALAGSTFLTGEFARTELGGLSGDATRVELRHDLDPIAARLFFLDSDPTFRNPSSPIGRGRREFGFLGAARLTGSTRLLGEALSTEDRLTGGDRIGARIGIEQAFGDWVRGQLAFRHAEESSPGAGSDSGRTPSEVDAIGIRLQAVVPGARRAAFWGEFEQDVTDAGRRRAEVAGEYAVPGLEGVRVYARHEFISSFTGPWGLAPDQERNSTVLGVAVENRGGQAAFSEYRVGGAIAGRDAQAAVGLRNSWLVGDGVRLGGSVERVSPIGAGGQTATALTGGVEFTGRPDWKGSARLEYRSAGEEDNLFGSLGYARRLSDSWTLLGTSAFSTVLDGGRAYERTRVGLAYRQTERNIWNALARYEHRYDRAPDADSVETRRTAHILAAHADLRPSRALLLRGEWASKFATEDLSGLSISEAAHIAGARATVDIACRLDLGVIGRSLFSGLGGTRYGLGAEVGVLLANNLRLGVGYNVFGFRDRELSSEDHTDRGAYVRLGFKFDESLFGRRGNQREDGPIGCPTRATEPVPPPPPADLGIRISGSNRVSRNDTIPPVLRDTIDWVVNVRRVIPGQVGQVTVRAQLPDPGLTLVGDTAGIRRSGAQLSWPVRPGLLARGIEDTTTIRVLVPDAVPADSTLRLRAWLDISPPDRSQANDTAEFPTIVLTRHCPAQPPVPGREVRCPVNLRVSIFGPNVAERNETVRFRITTRNIGGDTATSVDLRVAVPPGWAVVDSGGAVSAAGELLWPPAARGGGPSRAPGSTSNRTWTWNVPDLGPGQAYHVTIALQAPAFVVASELAARTNTSPDEGSREVDLSDNEATHRIRVGPVPPEHDLAVVIDPVPPAAFEGDTVLFVLRTRNAGPASAGEVILTATLAETVQVVGLGVLANRFGETITWMVPGTLAAGASRADSVRVICPAGRVVIGAIVGGSGTDANRANNNAPPASVTCAPNIADLEVRVTQLTPDPVAAGNRVTWVITTTNRGPRPATGVEVLVRLPEGVRFIAADPAATPLANTVTWRVPGRLEPDASVRYTVTVTAPDQAREMLIGAAAFASAQTVDPDLRNNEAELSTPLEPPPTPPDPTDLDVTLVRRLVERGAVGHQVTFDVYVVNAAGIRAENVRLEARWPAGVTFVRATGQPTPTGNVVRWALRPGLDRFEAVREELVLRIPPSRPTLVDTVTIVATASTTTPEVRRDNNEDSTMVLLQQITITDTVRSTTIRQDTVITWWPITEPRWFPWVLLLLLAIIAVTLIVLAIRWWLRPSPVPVAPPPSTPPPPWTPPPAPPTPSPPAPPTPSPPTPPPVPVVIPPFVVPPTPSPGPPAPKTVIIPPILPIPGQPGGDVYCHIKVAERPGTGYLVDPDRFVTCAHLVQRLGVGQQVSLSYKGQTIEGVIEAMDLAADVAVLRLRQPIEGVEPLEFATHVPRLATLDGYAYVGRDPQQGSAVRGAVVDPDVRDRFGTGIMSVVAPELAEAMLDPDHARSGGPLLVGGRVVGHICKRILHPDSLERGFAGLIQATPAKRILELLGREPPTQEAEEPSYDKRVRDACATHRRVYLRHDERDAQFAQRLAARLEGAGLRVFVSQHVAGHTNGEIDREALKDSGVAVIVHGRRDAEALGIEAIEERASADASFRIIVTRTTDGEIPDRLRRHTSVDFCGSEPDQGDALRRLERELIGELDLAQGEVWETIAWATDTVVAELTDARGRVRRLRFLAKRWREAGMPHTYPDLLAAELLLEVNRPDLALEAVQRVPAGLRGDGARIRQLEARARLAQNQEQDAAATIDALQAEGRLDARTATQFVEQLEQRWLRGGRRRQAPLRKAFDLAHDVFARTGDALSGVNAASFAALLGKADEARQLAARVQALLQERPEQNGEGATSLGLINLLLGDAEAALEWLGRAVGAHPDDIDRIGRVGQRVRWLLRKVEQLAPLRETLETRLAEIFRLPRVAAFGLPPQDPAALGSLMTSPEAEAMIQRDVRGRLAALDIGAGVGCINDAADLVVAEEILRRGGRLRILLPFPRDVFVSLVAQPENAKRLERALMHPSVHVSTTLDQVPSPDRTSDAMVHCTSEIVRTAEEISAAWGQKPVLLSFSPASDAPIGVDRLAEEGFEIVFVEPGLRFEAEEPAAEPVPPAAEPSDEPAPPKKAKPAPAKPEVTTRDMARRKPAAKAREQRGYAKLHLLAIGIDQYTEWRQLANAVNDAKGVAAALESEFGFECRLLLNEDATEKNIRAVIKDELPKVVGPDDLFVFFFAGHGHTERLPDDEEHGYLVPVDAAEGSRADLLEMEDVVSWTANLPSRHVLYILDACFSGISALAGGFTKRGKTRDARIAIAAGTAEQVVLDGGVQGSPANHSIFTGYLLQRLAGPEPADGELNDMTLYLYLLKRVEDATQGAQEPVHGALPGHGTGLIRFPPRLTS